MAHLLGPFFTAKETSSASCQHRLFLSQIEFCDNMVFRRRAALNQLGERLLDANRTIGRPDKISVIFGRRITKRYGDTLQTSIQDFHLGSPVIHSNYKSDPDKQYVRGKLALRTEATSCKPADFGIGKAVQNLPKARNAPHQVTDRYLDVQQDILKTFVDGGHLRQLGQPTITSGTFEVPTRR